MHGRASAGDRAPLRGPLHELFATQLQPSSAPTKLTTRCRKGSPGLSPGATASGKKTRLSVFEPESEEFAPDAGGEVPPVPYVFGDGLLAFWKAERPRWKHRQHYLGRVLLRSAGGRDGPGRPSPGRTQSRAGAGRALLVTAHSCLICTIQLLAPGVYAFAEPGGRRRALELSHVVAVSPDGRFVLGGYVPVPGQDSPSAIVRVVEVATGRVRAELDLERAGDESVRPHWLVAGLAEGTWLGNRIAAVASSGNVSSIVLLRFARNRLRVERVLRLDDEARLPSGYGPFFGDPRFLDEVGRQLGVRVDVVSRDEKTWYTAFLTCDLPSVRCQQGKPTPARRWLVLID